MQAIGPVLFNWAPERWRDHYFRVADEAPVDAVYVGEAVCFKRAPLFGDVMPEVVARLQAAGKTVVSSTLAEVIVLSRRTTAPHPRACAAARITSAPWSTSTMSAPWRCLPGKGARSVCVPPKCRRGDGPSVRSRRGDRGAGVRARPAGFVGPLLSRARTRTKDTCQFVCDSDPR
jgi:O2-independent ubiquinone biosynthesis protein UbiV